MSNRTQEKKKFLATFPYIYRTNDQWMEGSLNHNGTFAGKSRPTEQPTFEPGQNVRALKPVKPGKHVPPNEADFIGAIVAMRGRNGISFALILRPNGQTIAVPTTSIIGIFHDRLDALPEVDEHAFDNAIDQYIEETTSPLARRMAAQPAFPMATQQAPVVQRPAQPTIQTASTQQAPVVQRQGGLMLQGGGDPAMQASTPAVPVRQVERPQPGAPIQFFLTPQDADVLVDALRVAITEMRGENFGQRARRLHERLKAIRGAPQAAQSTPPTPGPYPTTTEVHEEPHTQHDSDLPDTASGVTEEEEENQASPAD